MSHRKVMQQALETLESLQGGCTDSGDGTVEAITVYCPEIIEALRTAIEEMEQEEPVGEVRDFKYSTVFLYKMNTGEKQHYLPVGAKLYTHPATIPEGWQLVPVEPTEEMLVAGYETEMFPEDRTPREIYNAMLAAAPKPGGKK